MDRLELHRTRYAEEFRLDELRCSRIGPCLRWVEEEQRARQRQLNVLDVGCGNGTVSRLFLDAGHNVFGVDIVPQLVERAVGRGVEARTADLEREGLPFGQGQMDVVYAGALIEHLYDPEFFLGECRRVLRDGGMLLLTTPNIGSLTSRLRMLLGKGPKFYASALGWEFGGHIRIHTAASLSRLLEESHFHVESIISNVVSLIPSWHTRRPWSVNLGRRLPSLGEVLIVKARSRPRQGPP